MSDHTPGPWEACLVGESGGYAVMADDGLYPRVAYVHLLPEVKANARLIAAAPDLLAAAEEAFDAINEMEFLYNTGQDISEQTDAVFFALDHLRAAIKKSKGQL